MLLKKLFKEARLRLISEFDKKEIVGLLSKLDKTLSRIDVRKNMDGLAIFINNSFEKIIHLPFSVNERVIIDKNFAVRDLIRAVNRGINYYTLSISAGFIRLFEAHRDNFSEITENGFPFVNPLPRRSNHEESTSLKENRLKEFFNMVDKSFGGIYNQHPLPVVIAGVERNIALYTAISAFAGKFITTVQGNYDEYSPHELSLVIWPEVKIKMTDKRRQELRKLDEALSKRRFVSGIEEVWRLASENRGELLIVEEDYQQSAKIHKNGGIMTLSPANGSTDSTDDIVDEIAAKVVSAGGKVIFTENGKLQDYDHIALTLKF